MATKVEKKDFAKYLLEARTWETDRLATAEKSKKLAWVIAIIASGLAFVSIIAVAGLTPLKQTELKIVRVDNVTGIVDVVTEIPNAKTNYDEAVNKYFLQLYIRFREGYSKELAQDYYTSVGLMSGATEQKRYFESFNPKNSLSPLIVYGDRAKVKVKMKSVSFLKSNVALVRYTKEVEWVGTDKPMVTHWASTLVFGYLGAPMSEKDRAVNPLGFQVTEFRPDPDSPVADPSAAPAPLPASAPGNGVMVLSGISPNQAPTAAQVK